MTRPDMVIAPEVAAALADRRPVVALESTIITHGMPWPDNAEAARAVEAVVRSEGASPATIAVLDGVIHVGLDDARLEALAQAKGVMKLSRADLAFAVAARRNGATTVAVRVAVACCVAAMLTVAASWPWPIVTGPGVTLATAAFAEQMRALEDAAPMTQPAHVGDRVVGHDHPAYRQPFILTSDRP